WRMASVPAPATRSAPLPQRWQRLLPPCHVWRPRSPQSCQSDRCCMRIKMIKPKADIVHAFPLKDAFPLPCTRGRQTVRTYRASASRSAATQPLKRVTITCSTPFSSRYRNLVIAPVTDTPLTYAEAGVDIDAGNRLVEAIGPGVAATRRPEVLDNLGGFGGLFELPVARYQRPVLVSCTDGVGTKLRLAIASARLEGIGIDLVAMCVNDVLVSGAEPLFFLDYYATARLQAT